jgi:aminopeptidase 2
VVFEKHAYENAKTSDLWVALSHVSGKDVGELMESWTKHVRYPVVDVDEREDSAVLTQHRFLQDGTPELEDDKVLYPLSLKLRTKDGIDSEVTLHHRAKTFKVPEFFKLNEDHTGFYRVAYSAERLQILGQIARDGLLSVNDRIRLLSDALAVAQSGRSKTSTILHLLQGF